MRMIPMTPAGPTVSIVGLGCNSFWLSPVPTYVDYSTSAAIVRTALESGYTIFDTADVYGAGESERFLGKALGADRASIIIATKFGYPMPGAPAVPHGRTEYVRWAVAQSLARIGTDYIDIYNMHRPDDQTPIAETLGALQELISEGTLRFIGSSQFTADQLRSAADAARGVQGPEFISAMMHYSLLTRTAEEEVLPACRELGMTLVPYFPLESGLLTGKYSRAKVLPDGRLANQLDVITDSTWNMLETLERFAVTRGISMLDLAIGGVAAMSGVGPVMVGATRPDQVVANARASDWRPTPDELDALQALRPAE
jgi:aryl-alcohol dehydrogenase-like predicted oxidoreductase